MIEVDFQHWKYTFSEDDLANGSPNKRKDKAKLKLCAALKKAILVSNTSKPMLFDEEQIICANEAFPEAAIADPLADIEVWNEWRNGIRIFPYPGKYAKLSITHQLPKTSSTSSIGVIGEIMAGLFGQVIIGYDVLVRVIHAWPDFIFFPVLNCYGFLEAKAFTPQLDSYLDDYFKIPKTALGECLLNAVHHLAIDPYVKMWYSFTEIKQVVPIMKFSVNFFELEVSDERRYRHDYSIPSPVVDGLAERAIQVAIANLEIDLNSFKTKIKSSRRKYSENKLIKASQEYIDYLMELLRLEIYEENFKEKILRSIQQQVEDFKIIDSKDSEYNSLTSNQLLFEGEVNEYFDIKYELLEDGIKFIRRIGDKTLYQIKLYPKQRLNIGYNWKNDFKNADQCYKTVGNHRLWRCGSSIFFLCKDKEKEELFKIIKKEMGLNQ
ncbi:hypothetical protein [Nostoc sp. FACHB-133]|uniref:hypothetical protein n=1 Tax=Nostoc sp. FACHB-133 TaxID=2692835 RepID=UPI0016847EBD|nr:hypothetical protein [Nostoc sp. FACHB-133]MBD2527566.1 hypothetical protein [Nostoc sp. FACHB-133]